MNADHAKFLAASLGQNLQTEWMTTYKVLNAIPEDKKDWKPETNARTAWDLAYHIATIDVGFLNAVIGNSFASGFPAACPATTIKDLTEWYKHEFPKVLERMLTLDGAHMSTVVDFYGMKLPSVLYVMFCNNHMIHHRGQISTYLRPMGSKVPSIYGGGFDEAYQG
jgi:uncharacterized damage-inducible protein DinB